MPITIEQIDHLAHLARLELTSTEKKKYQKDISAILKYVEKVQEIHEKVPSVVIPAKLVPERHRGAGIQHNGRKDIVINCPVDEREVILSNFPEQEGKMVKVRTVFE